MHFNVSWDVLTSGQTKVYLSFLAITEKTFVTLCFSLP